MSQRPPSGQRSRRDRLLTEAAPLPRADTARDEPRVVQADRREGWPSWEATAPERRARNAEAAAVQAEAYLGKRLEELRAAERASHRRTQDAEGAWRAGLAALAASQAAAAKELARARSRQKTLAAKEDTTEAQLTAARNAVLAAAKKVKAANAAKPDPAAGQAVEKARAEAYETLQPFRLQYESAKEQRDRARAAARAARAAATPAERAPESADSVTPAQHAAEAEARARLAREAYARGREPSPPEPEHEDDAQRGGVQRAELPLGWPSRAKHRRGWPVPLKWQRLEDAPLARAELEEVVRKRERDAAAERAADAAREQAQWDQKRAERVREVFKRARQDRQQAWERAQPRPRTPLGWPAPPQGAALVPSLAALRI